MNDDSHVEKPFEFFQREFEHRAIKPARYRFARAIGIASLILLAALFVTAVVFRVLSPISPIRLAEIFGNVSVNQTWLPLEKISPDLPLAVIASEDGRYSLT